MSSSPAIVVEGLTVSVPTAAGRACVVDDVGFAIAPGEALGLVGESGSGKSMTALALMGLLRMSGARLEKGSIRLAGREVADLPDAGWRALRGRVASMIFQDPLMSLNPVHRVGAQIAEAVATHRGLGSRAAWAAAVEMLEAVGLPDPAARARAYPHQLSGGQRQRVMIAMALACRPALLIADEPTTALDVTVQAQILALIDRLRRETGAAVLFISHDLGVVSRVADRVAVMYAGRLVETAPAATLFATPEHPYTIGLLGSTPDLDRPDRPLLAMHGAAPAPAAFPPGCRFAPRCPFAEPPCVAGPPRLAPLDPVHAVACRRAPLGFA